MITTIILSEKDKGTFKLVDFYERRARRILPALFLVIFVSFPFAYNWLLPEDMKDFSQSLVAITAFSSNILFWQETGYWGAENELKPMLHTWSLAVEEQYYLLFPLLLLLLGNFRKKLLLSTLWILVLSSLLLSQWMVAHFPSANFFLLPTRAWELGIGALTAYWLMYKGSYFRLKTPTITNEILGLVGLALILWAIFVFDDATPFPSVYALVPTVGSGLVILYASKQTFTGKLLGAKLPVGIGLISYSAYLWHQPLFAFARHRSLTEPELGTYLSLTLLTLLLAYITWRWIEAPFRSKTVFSRKKIFGLSAMGTALVFSLGILGHLTDGFSSPSFGARLSKHDIESKLSLNYGLNTTCQQKFTLSKDCRTSDAPEILVWGDSYSMHLVDGILASNPEVKLIQMTKSVCGPFFDIAPVTPKYPVSWAEECLAFTGQVKNWLIKNDSVRYVVMSSPFYQFIEDENQHLRRDGSLQKASLNLAIEEFESTLEFLKGIGLTPVIFSPPPSNGNDLGRCLAKANWFELESTACNFLKKDMLDIRLGAYYLIDTISSKYKVIRLDDFLCNSNNCETQLNGKWIYRDKGHLSHEGSKELGTEFNFYKLIVNG